MKPKMLILLLVISASVMAQEHKNDDLLSQFRLGVGVSFQKFDGLNGRISKFPQYKELSDFAGTLELGMSTERNRMISEAGLFIGSSMTNHDEKRSDLRFVGINIGVGYDVLKEKNIALYPLVGLGFEGVQARFFQDHSSVPFDSLLQFSSAESNLHSVDFTNYFFNYRLGFGVSLKSDKQPFGSVGLRAVYTGSFSSQSWKSNQGQSLSDAPEDKLSQFQITLIFGKQANCMKH